MKTILLSTSAAVLLLALAASYVLPRNGDVERLQPYKFALAR